MEVEGRIMFLCNTCHSPKLTDIQHFAKDVSTFLLIVQSDFSYQRNWYGRGEHGEKLVPKIIPLLCSKWKGKDKKTNKGMKSSVEPI
jgi:hypothetical protein